MKISSLSITALGLSAAATFAFEIPRSAHEMSALEDARAKAAERPELVSFLISRVSMRET